MAESCFIFLPLEGNAHPAAPSVRPSILVRGPLPPARAGRAQGDLGVAPHGASGICSPLQPGPRRSVWQQTFPANPEIPRRAPSLSNSPRRSRLCGRSSTANFVICLFFFFFTDYFISSPLPPQPAVSPSLLVCAPLLRDARRLGTAPSTPSGKRGDLRRATALSLGFLAASGVSSGITFVPLPYFAVILFTRVFMTSIVGMLKSRLQQLYLRKMISRWTIEVRGYI